MVQIMERSETSVEAPVPIAAPRGDFGPENEFAYRPVPVLAVAGLVVSLISTIAIFVWLALPLCLVGFALSAIALFVIRRSRGAYGGTIVAVCGMVMSLLCLGGGIALQIHTYQTEVPEGYARTSFVQDIAGKPLVPQGATADVHPDVKALDGQQIFLKGYIYQTGQLHNLTNFLFVKDNEDCCFGADPAITDRVGVFMKDGNAIDYVGGKVAVAGTFRINPEFSNASKLEPLYIIDCEIFSSRVSDF